MLIFCVFHLPELTIPVSTRLIQCNERDSVMINTQTIRRPMLALIAGSALLLGGAAMPRFCLHNPTMLYVIGEVKMAVGDHDGGLQMIGFAANQNGSAQAQSSEAPKPATKTAEPESKICTRTPVAAPTPKPRTVVMVRHSDLPTPSPYLQLAKLQNVDFTSASFDEAQFEAQMRQAAEMREAQHAQHTLKKVRMELERRGIAVPQAFPVPPAPPTV